ncbi:hypothetical protein E2C01_064377 [Portunus trituberculatus]|uniref:Uncharacterized protein n=1 Tax=Portunus trituberculatus TaxID=210409 RepID=A0A5B7HN26_PORTR|nr:hypothetical protein [Portunus trituberculatus]
MFGNSGRLGVLVLPPRRRTQYTIQKGWETLLPELGWSNASLYIQYLRRPSFFSRRPLIISQALVDGLETLHSLVAQSTTTTTTAPAKPSFPLAVHVAAGHGHHHLTPVTHFQNWI